MPNGIVTLTTDFGVSDSYVAEMKGALLSIDPSLTLVDVSHLVPRHDVPAGAYLLQRAVDHFPAGTVHVAIVDPGVGSDRRGLALEGPAGLFVGPDNGLFAFALREFSDRVGPDLVLSSNYRAVSLTNSSYWGPTVSTTFHGRDIFAPVAARLAGGEDILKLGDPVHSIRGLPASTIVIDENEIKTRILWIDHFGNVILAVQHREIGNWESCAVEIAGREVTGLVSSYEEAVEPRLLVGSSGLLEVAVYCRSAAQDLGVKRGDEVALRRLV